MKFFFYIFLSRGCRVYLIFPTNNIHHLSVVAKFHSKPMGSEMRIIRQVQTFPIPWAKQMGVLFPLNPVIAQKITAFPKQHKKHLPRTEETHNNIECEQLTNKDMPTLISKITNLEYFERFTTKVSAENAVFIRYLPAYLCDLIKNDIRHCIITT